jgi:hypothetical protein
MKFREYLQEKYKASVTNRGFKYYIYVNPTKEEVESIYPDFLDAEENKDFNPLEAGVKKNHPPIRGFFDDKANLYVWLATMLHKETANGLKLKDYFYQFEYRVGGGTDKFEPYNSTRNLNFLMRNYEKVASRMKTAFPDVTLPSKEAIRKELWK